MSHHAPQTHICQRPGKREQCFLAKTPVEDHEAIFARVCAGYDGSRTVARCWTEAIKAYESEKATGQ